MRPTWRQLLEGNQTDYAINCKYAFNSMYRHYDPDTATSETRFSTHSNYGQQVSSQLMKYLDHYKWRKRRR